MNFELQIAALLAQKAHRELWQLLSFICDQPIALPHAQYHAVFIANTTESNAHLIILIP